MLGNCCLNLLKSLALGEVGQHTAIVGIFRLFLQGGTEDALDLPPALGQNTLAFRREGMAAAIESDRDGLILIRACRRTQQLAAY